MPPADKHVVGIFMSFCDDFEFCRLTLAPPRIATKGRGGVGDGFAELGKPLFSSADRRRIV